MKKLFLALTFISVTGFSAISLEEITGQYLGSGTYLTTSGQSDSYSSFAVIMPKLWALAYLANGQMLEYYAAFEVDENGFLDTAIIELTNGDGQFYYGYGYCLDNYCHMTVDINDNGFEETITLLKSGEIRKVGSLRYIDEDGNHATMRWEEKLVRMSLLPEESVEEEWEEGEEFEDGEEESYPYDDESQNIK
jgi:hypothetical protein